MSTLDRIEVIEVLIPGQQGPQGEPGDAGNQNLFVQETDPNMTDAGLWIELNGDGTVKTFWVENGV